MDERVNVLATLDGVLDEGEGLADGYLVTRVQTLIVLLRELAVLLHHLVQFGLHSATHGGFPC